MTTPLCDIGNRLELMVDTWLVEAFRGSAALRLHSPIPREVALLTDRPWEGNMCGYITVLRDGDLCRMYYRTGQFNLSGEGPQPIGDLIALAESSDGIHWERPELGLYEVQGSRANNLIWVGEGEDMKGVHGFAPFLDPRPDVPPEARYKAVGAALHSSTGLFAMISPDGIHWSLLQEEPIITDGAFDSQNLVFWDSERGEYRAYIRDFRNGCRGIRTATSPDFIHWSTPLWLEYPGTPEEQLYTNQVAPYYRAPHLFLGFPTRYVERPWSPAIEALPEPEHRRLRASLHPRYGAALTDGVFMSSRDGRTFNRWLEAFIRPGPQLEGNWAYGDNYLAWGMLETPADLPGAPPELSFYGTEHYWRGNYTILRRYTLRVDGFVSVQAPLSGGELVTRPLRFAGQRLLLNMATSAAGSLRVEIQDAQGHPLEGYTLDDCYEIIGDELARPVQWKGGDNLGALAGTPVRLRVALQDADLYALRFA
jgi:hypothetical protein